MDAQRCDNCGDKANLYGIQVVGQAAERLGISEDAKGGYNLCDHCFEIAFPQRVERVK